MSKIGELLRKRDFRVAHCQFRLPLNVALVLLGSLTPCAATFADEAGDTDQVQPPIAGRPAEFSGAIGSHFDVQMRAAPVQLQAEDPLLLTVIITGTGDLQAIQRPNLRRLHRFAEQFHIDNLAERRVAAENACEFDYRLRPRTAAVKEIPPLPFVFFNPKILAHEKGYQTTLARAIPLTVQSREKMSLGRVEGKSPRIEAPDSVYQLVEGSMVLRHKERFELPGPFELGGLLLGPPVLGGFWYIVWRQRHPDAVSQARKRRGRAAQNALKALHRLGKLDALAQAQQAEAVMSSYLRQRLALLAAEPTPAEVAQRLEQSGSSPALAQEGARFFAACDAARFAPGVMAKGDNWPETATRLILALEEESWPS